VALVGWSSRRFSWSETLKPEKAPSLEARKFSALWGLLGILGPFLVTSLLSKSKISRQDSERFPKAKDNTEQERNVCKDEPPPFVRVTVDSMPPPDTPIEERRAKEYKHDKREQALYRVHVGTLIAVMVYAALTLGLWRTTQGQLDVSREHFRVDERAWIGLEISRPILRIPADKNFPPGFTYELNARNTGKTVARCVEIRAPKAAALGSFATVENNVWVDNLQDKFLLGKFKNSADIPINRLVPTALAPGQATPIPITLAGQAPKNNFGSILVGRIDYIDEFMVRHWVKFCYLVEGPNGQLGYCKYGNGEDDNPEKPPAIQPSCPVGGAE